MKPMNCHEMDYIVIVDEYRLGLTPGYDYTDGVVRSCNDAERGEVADVHVLHSEHDEIPDTADDGEDDDGDATALVPVAEPGVDAENHGADGVGRDGEQLGLGVGCTGGQRQQLIVIIDFVGHVL